MADDTLVQDLVEAKELLLFPFDQALDRNAGPSRHDLRDLVLVDFFANQPLRSGCRGLRRAKIALERWQSSVFELGRALETRLLLRLRDVTTHALDLLAEGAQLADRFLFGLPARLHGARRLTQIGQLRAQGGEPILARLVGLLPQRRFLDLELADAARRLVELGRHAVDLGSDGGAGFIDQVDRLVRQEAIADVAIREHRRRHQRGVEDLDPVVHLEALLQSAEDGDRVLDARRVDRDRLETAFERGVLLDVLAILVEGGGADAMELAAREHRLEQVAGVGRSLGLSRADDVVELVDEEDDVPIARLDLVQHRLQALLELAAELRARQERAQIEREDAAALQPLRNVTAHDALCEAFDDRGLPHARLPDQNRVVLRLSREDADHAADLGVAPDHRVELARARLRDQIDPELRQRLVRALRIGTGHALVAAHLGERAKKAVAVDAGRAKGVPSRPTVLEEREHEMLDRDVLVLEALGLVLGAKE